MLSDEIKIEKIEQIYSGRPGCMCGCRGNYYEGKQLKRMLKNFEKFIAAGNVASFEEGQIYASSETKTYVIYLKK